MLLLVVIFVSLYARLDEVSTVRPSIYKDIRPDEDTEFKEVYKGDTGLILFGKDLNKLFFKKSKLGTRRSHWYFQSFPILYPSIDTGFNYGARIMLYELSRYPYKYHLLAQYWASDRGRTNHEIKFIVPSIFNHLYFRLKFRYFTRISARYFGIGDVINHQEYTDPDSASYITKVYYWYKLHMPITSAFLGARFFDKRLMLYTNLLFGNVDISTHYQDYRSFVYTNKPYGFSGGYFNYLKFGVILDTREQETNPSSGFLADTTFTRFGILGGDYSFNALSLSYTYFKAIPRYFTLATRILGSYLFGGTIPFFAYNYFYANDDVEGLGGDTLRGYTSGRFIDNLKTSLQFELRTRFYEGMLGSKLIEFDIVPFMDFGTVADSFSTYSLKNIKMSYGSSFRLIINSRSMVRVTLEHSPESTSMGLGFEENFK